MALSRWIIAVALTLALVYAVSVVGLQPTRAAAVAQNDLVTVCPTAGRLALRRDPDNAKAAQVIGQNCVVYNALSTSDGELDASNYGLDVIISLPDVPTINLAFNRLQAVPPATDNSNYSGVISLILAYNPIASMADVAIPPRLHDLSNCQLTDFKRPSFPDPLVVLRLSQNQLQSLVKTNFPPRLRVLFLNDQPLRDIAHASFPPTLEKLYLANTSLSKLDATQALPRSLLELDVSRNQLVTLPDLSAQASITEVNVSFNSISEIRGISFPLTLKRLDLRGNPLREVEIARSDLPHFRDWTYLLPSVSQPACRHSEATRERVKDADLCVLDDRDFDRLYGQRKETSTIGSDSGNTLIDGSVLPPSSKPETAGTRVDSDGAPMTWTYLIAGIVVVVIAVVGIISMVSWKHQQLRQQMREVLAYQSRARDSSLTEDLLRAVGLTGDLVTTRIDADDLRVLHVLGKHGYGIVYAAEWRNPRESSESDDCFDSSQERPVSLLDMESAPSLRYRVTLKRMIPEQSGAKNPSSLKAFLREIQLLSQLEHPNVIRLLGVSWNTLTDVTMVMEHLPNGNLRALLRAEKERLALGHSRRLRWVESHTSFASTMSITHSAPPSKIAIAMDIAEALIYLHARPSPVIHRELRSKNVYFDAQYNAKVCNFGAPNETQLDVTRAPSLDSVAWIAPEILRGERYTEKSDIYAFGIILSELATCSGPFEGIASAAVVIKVTAEHERPSVDDADCPELIQQLAYLCMSADVAKRPSAPEMQRELQVVRSLSVSPQATTMDPESKELLREWLIRSLEPVCDADPEVLSKYVLALLQNNPQSEGLRATCISKLEEFLGDETTPFVDRLLSALETGAYKRDDSANGADVDDRSAESDRRDGHAPSRGRDDHRGRRHGDYDDRSGRDRDGSRRRPRSHDSGSHQQHSDAPDDDEHRRASKRRRDDDYSPRRGNGPRDRGYPADRRRNYPPEWGMPPQSMGMWPPPPHHPHHAPPFARGGPPVPFPMPPDFDPNVYNPDHPGMMPPPMMMGRPGFYPYGGGRGRGGRGNGGYHYGGGRHGAGLPRQDSAGADSGADGPSGNAPTVGAKTTLRVSNVDPKYINMTKLSLHFSKFGNVVNVQMRPNHRCAYVQYATEEEAKKAFHSPIPVCNNRFIEVKWAKYDARDPHGAPSEKDENSSAAAAATASTDDATEEAGATTEASATSASAVSTEESAVEKEMTTEELRAAALEQGRKVLEEKRELLEKQRQLMKQKEELLKRQLAQQKELLERMSQNSASVSAADKRELLNKITALSEELKALQPARKDAGDQQSKLSGLKAELSALEAQANGASFSGGRGAFGGRGGRGGRVSQWGPSAGAPGRGFYGRGPGGRGRGGRGSFSNTLDNRTTIVKIEQLPDEARDPSVLEQHFGNFGAIDRVVMDESQGDRAYIKFKDRYSGQSALTRGSTFGAARLQLAWVEAQDAPSQLGQSSSPAPEAAGAGAIPAAASTNGETQEVSASA
ncbi:hypothetical protein ATCC90586_009493 [Pythium insidiosum]|nr:hypothetical protein ATCC90586_009493 [Pythium insidiosum]